MTHEFTMLLAAENLIPSFKPTCLFNMPETINILRE